MPTIFLINYLQDSVWYLIENYMVPYFLYNLIFKKCHIWTTKIMPQSSFALLFKVYFSF